MTIQGLLKGLFFGIALVGLVACSSRPVRQIVLADVAIKAAQKAKADSLATDLYRKAENHYLRAQKDYRDGYFDSCRKFADKARRLAEQAEYRAILKQAKIKGTGSANDYE